MNERLENIISLASALRLASVDFEALYPTASSNISFTSGIISAFL